MRLEKSQIETLKLAQNGQVSSIYAGRFTNYKRKYSGASESVVISLINKNLLQEHYIGRDFREIQYIPTELAKNFYKMQKKRS